MTTPAGVVNGPYSDAPAFDVWQRVNIAAIASVGITGDYPRSGKGSVLLDSGDVNGRTTWQYSRTGGFGPLSSFTSATYEWYRDASSTVAAHFHPTYLIQVDNDGNPATTGDQSWLFFERGAMGPYTAPTGTLVTETINDSTKMWVFQVGAANTQNPVTTMAQFKAGAYVPEAGGFAIPATATILRIRVSTGTGWPGTFRGAVDNIGIVAASSVGPDNFELAPPPPATVAPVPATDLWALLSLSSLLAGVAAWRQRRRRS
ncbi:IPTL-CTERM sorting domain-containing protein [Ottowia pentelensis]|uniref:IPTL-CTERM sorting domain-containing protein n=1 Tax=Ottowia pentelensis TaxID=511108 RepID=A0ABV6PRN4_9BURK